MMDEAGKSDRAEHEIPPCVEVIVAVDAQRPISLQLPASVVRLTQEHGCKELPNPAVALVTKLRKWMDRKRNGDCFDEYGWDPTLYYWALEHFSELSLTDEERVELVYHILEFADGLDGVARDLVCSANNDLLDYYWYALVQLLALEHKLTVMCPQRSSMEEEHIALIQDRRKVLLHEMTCSKQLGWLNVDSPRACIEQKLIVLAQGHPHLGPYVTPMLSAGSWAELVDEGGVILWDVHEHCWDLDDDDDDDDFDSLEDELIVSLHRANKLTEQLWLLFQAMNPEDEDDRAWDHPLEYLEGESKDKQALFLHPAMGPSGHEDLSTAQKFDLDFVERMARHGFKNWVFSRPEWTLIPLGDWLEKVGDERSFAGMQQLVQEYMLLTRGQRVPSLREYLGFPHVAEPIEVTRCVRYWQEVWERKEVCGASVRLFHCSIDNERAAALEYLGTLQGQKFIEVGDALDVYTFYHGVAREDQAYHIHHDRTRPEYLEEEFVTYKAVKFVAHEIGRRRGFGIHESSAMPLRRHEKLLRTLFDMQGGGDFLYPPYHFGSGYSLSRLGEHGGDYVDSVVFTSEGDDEGDGGEVEPSEVDEGAPLVGQH